MNHLFGSVYFTSDDVSCYDEKQLKLLRTARRWASAKVSSVKWNNGKVSFTVTIDGKSRIITLLPDGRIE